MTEQPHPSHEGEPSADDRAPEARPSRRKLFASLFAVGTIVGGGAAWARWKMGTWRFDSTPLLRPWHNAPYIKTPPDVVEKMLETAQVQAGELLYDLGCGDGRIAVAAAEKFGCRSVGFDIDPQRIAEANENARQRGVADRATFEQKDVFTLDLSQVDVVAAYLLPQFMARLVPQFKQMQPGSRIVSHDFPIEGFPPDQTATIVSEADRHEHRIYRWNAPLGAAVPQP